MADEFTQQQREEYLSHVRNGMRRGAAAEAVGHERWVVLGYISEHPEFEIRVLDAEKEATEHVEEALYQAAVSGNVAAAVKWLERIEGKRSRGHPAPASEGSGGGSEDDVDVLMRELDA